MKTALARSPAVLLPLGLLGLCLFALPPCFHRLACRFMAAESWLVFSPARSARVGRFLALCLLRGLPRLLAYLLVLALIVAAGFLAGHPGTSGHISACHPRAVSSR